MQSKIFLRNIPTWLLGMHYFNTVMKKEGISVRDCFGHDFTWNTIKECIIYSIKMSLPGLIGSVSALAQLWIWLIYCTTGTYFPWRTSHISEVVLVGL